MATQIGKSSKGNSKGNPKAAAVDIVTETNMFLYGVPDRPETQDSMDVDVDDNDLRRSLADLGDGAVLLPMVGADETLQQADESLQQADGSLQQADDETQQSDDETQQADETLQQEGTQWEPSDEEQQKLKEIEELECRQDMAIQAARLMAMQESHGGHKRKMMFWEQFLAFCRSDEGGNFTDAMARRSWEELSHSMHCPFDEEGPPTSRRRIGIPLAPKGIPSGGKPWGWGMRLLSFIFRK
jgi:hypothetical protein